MNSKILAVVFGVSLLLGLGLAQTSFNEEKVNQEKWQDVPMYMEDAEITLDYSDTVETKQVVERCTEYNETNSSTGGIECLSYEDQTVPDETVRPIKFRNQGFEYLGNGEVKISFEARVNQKLVGPINSDKFKERYFLNGETPTESEYIDFVSGLNSVSFAATENSEIKGSKVSSNNVNAGWQDMTFVVEMQNFRSGGVTLSQHSSIKLETMNANGGGLR